MATARWIGSVLPLCFAAICFAQESKVPKWDAQGRGPLPRQGVAALDVSADGSQVVVGTIAPAGEPSVHVLDRGLTVVKSYRVGQRWIGQVVATKSGSPFALCTMTTGASGDEPQVYFCGEQPTIVSGSQGGMSLFHYGEHSNHIGKQLVSYDGGAITVSESQVLWMDSAEPKAKSPFRNLKVTSLAAHRSGVVVVGGYFDGPMNAAPVNVHVFRPGDAKPLWQREVLTDVGASNLPEAGEYGRPTLADGSQNPLPQRDEPIFAPLSIAVSREAEFDPTKTRIAIADYRGWRRWIRSSGSGKDEDYGTRFMPAKPTVTVLDGAGQVVRRFGPEKFDAVGWVDLVFTPSGRKVIAVPHRWACRGLAGESFLPVDDDARTLSVMDLESGEVQSRRFEDAIASADVTEKGTIVVSCWDSRMFWLSENALSDVNVTNGVKQGGPFIIKAGSKDDGYLTASGRGQLNWMRSDSMPLVKLDQLVPATEKQWVKNAKAAPLAKGLWQLPGGRVESDLGGQRVIEGTEGLILIEGHAGLSFESEWAAMEAAGLDPKQVKYVLTTHEHGDHSPGAYLWRVTTGAQFICSREMAYVLQHHLPVGTGYGLHPPVPTDIKIDDDKLLDLCGVKVAALRLPGHTFGSMGWMFEREGKRFVAIRDLIMPDGVLGYAGSINFSPYQVLDSLKKLDGLNVDTILPGHGPVVGPEKYVAAGIAVGARVGWGKMKASNPDPRFRLTQENVLVTGFLSEAVSGAFGDIDGNGTPDFVTVSPRGEGSVVTVFANKSALVPRLRLGTQGREALPQVRSDVRSIEDALVARGDARQSLDPLRSQAEPGNEQKWFDPMKPSFEVGVPNVANPNRVRLLAGDARQSLGPLRSETEPRNACVIYVSGQSTGAFLMPSGKGNNYDTVTVSAQETHQARVLDVDGQQRAVVLGRFSGAQAVVPTKDGKWSTQYFNDALKAPYLDVLERDLNGDGRVDRIVNNGTVWLRSAEGSLPKTPSVQLPLPVAGDWCFLSLGDFNGDRKVDVALVSYGAGPQRVISTFLNTGDSTKQFATTPSGTMEIKSQQPHVRDAAPTADWNKDGFEDLFIGLGQDNQVRVFLGSATGLSADRVETIPLDFWLHYEHPVTVADFNGDGELDLGIFGYTKTGVGAGGPPAGYIWLKPKR